jgi:hypothetical protein
VGQQAAAAENQHRAVHEGIGEIEGQELNQHEGKAEAEEHEPPPQCPNDRPTPLPLAKCLRGLPRNMGGGESALGPVVCQDLGDQDSSGEKGLLAVSNG